MSRGKRILLQRRECFEDEECLWRWSSRERSRSDLRSDSRRWCFEDEEEDLSLSLRPSRSLERDRSRFRFEDDEEPSLRPRSCRRSRGGGEVDRESRRRSDLLL